MKRGRKPVGRKAMTAAERQARRRAKLRQIAKDGRRRLDEYQRAPGEVRLPPHGYNKAKAKLQAKGHHFERTRREFGFEEGLFVDGAFVHGADVLALAELGASERKQWLDERRELCKSFAVDHVVKSVLTLTDRMQVCREELREALCVFRDGHEKFDRHEKSHEKQGSGNGFAAWNSSSGSREHASRPEL